MVAQRVFTGLEREADVSILVRNDALCADAAELPFDQAMATATNILSAGLTLLWRLIESPGYYTQFDVATFNAVLRYGKGRAEFGFATAQGQHRFETAMADLLDHPARGIRKPMRTAPAMLVGIIGGYDLRLKEIGDAMARIRMETDAECDIRMGTVQDANEGIALTFVVLLFREWECNVENLVPQAKTVTPSETPAGYAGLPIVADEMDLPHQSDRIRGEKGTFVDASVVRFRNTHPTISDGEDLDTPTYRRRGFVIDAE